MTTTRVRWGILSVAKINERLMPGFKRAGNAELRAIASRSLEKARRAAAAEGIPVAHGSYEALLDDPTIDAVYLPLPNHLHAEWTMKAAERGKHVLCEKPMASDAGEAQRAVEYCRQKKVGLMEGFMWPHHPRTAKLRELLDAGTIGEVRRVTSSFTFQLELDPQNIRLQEGMAGGSVMDVGCYPVYGARWIFGAEPTRVFATAEWQPPSCEAPSSSPPYEGGAGRVDLSMNAVMEFPGGRTALFDCGFTLPMRQWLEITGTAGKAWLEDMWLPAPRALIRVQRGEKPVETIAIEGEDQIVHMIQNFSAAILEGREATPGPEQGVATMKVLDALRRSAREGRSVAVG
jgi:predicted dehydrogenase